MANLIGKLRATSGRVETSASRLAEDEVEVHAASWNTFVTTTIDRLGRVTVVIARQMGDRAKDRPTVLTEIKLNSETSESPIFAADGLLRAQHETEGIDEWIATQHGLDRKEPPTDPFEQRDLSSDINEDR